MPDERFLAVRLGSLGDIVHALPAVAALRESFPTARLDWLVERKWGALVAACPDVTSTIAFDPGSWRAMRRCVEAMRNAQYTCAIDFQGLYKSALLTAVSGTSRRIGFDRAAAREGGAAVFYSHRVQPPGGHVIEQNLALAEAAGARRAEVRFPLRVPAGAEEGMARWLQERQVREYFVVSPGGGWRSKCWPAERYGELCLALERRYAWRGVVNYGPGEKALADGVCRAASDAEPLPYSSELPQLMALLCGAKFVVAGDTGPLHLAVALGTPVVGLYGPTDQQRNGPYCAADIVVRNARPGETTYKRGGDYSAPMLSISVEQVLAAVERRLGMAE